MLSGFVSQREGRRENEVVIEIKSVQKFAPVFLAQMMTYLRITGINAGLIVNFNTRFLRDGIRRVVL